MCVVIFLEKKGAFSVTKKYRKPTNLFALHVTLDEANKLLESGDEDMMRIGSFIKKRILKLLEEEKIERAKTEKRVEAKKKKYGPYTHAESTDPDD